MLNPYQQYKEQALSTLAPGEILVKLYDELAKQLKVAKINIEQNDFGASSDALSKSQTIVHTLADSLDMRYPVSHELRDLYIFISQHLSSANMKKDPQMIDECIPLVKDLREAFDQADKINRRIQHANIGGRAV